MRNRINDLWWIYDLDPNQKKINKLIPKDYWFSNGINEIIQKLEQKLHFNKADRLSKSKDES